MIPIISPPPPPGGHQTGVDRLYGKGRLRGLLLRPDHQFLVVHKLAGADLVRRQQAASSERYDLGFALAGPPRYLGREKINERQFLAQRADVRCRSYSLMPQLLDSPPCGARHSVPAFPATEP